MRAAWHVHVAHRTACEVSFIIRSDRLEHMEWCTLLGCCGDDIHKASCNLVVWQH